MLSRLGSGPTLIDTPAAQDRRGDAIEVSNVFKQYRRFTYRNSTLKGTVLDWLRGRSSQYDEFEALSGVSFSVPRGQTLGIIGPNGAGKSTLLRLLARLEPPDAGTIAVQGRVTPLLQLGAGFAPELTGRRNVYLYGALLGLKRREIEQRLSSIIAFSGISDFIDTPVKYYSSGMYLRLAFAVAAHVDPDVLLIDEVLAVGDLAYQEKCLARIDAFRRAGTTIVMVTHAIEEVGRWCDRAVLLDRGHIIEDGDPSVVVSAYKAATGH